MCAVACRSGFRILSMWVAARRMRTMLAGTAYETGVVGLSAGCVMVQQLVFALFPVFTLPVCFADFTYATTNAE